MGLFANILEKLGIKKEAEKPVTAVKTQKDSRPVPTTLKPATGGVRPPADTRFNQKAGPIPFGIKPKPIAIPVVDVVAKLEKLAKENPEKLDWKVSIVDLLKLLGIDSSFAARKELAVELGCPPEKMKESAEMNVWLHKTVLQKIAENGGNIPRELLD